MAADSAVSHLPSQRVGDRFRRSACELEAVPAERLFQLRDIGSTVPGKVHGEHVPELDSPQLSRTVHRSTVAPRSDIERRGYARPDEGSHLYQRETRGGRSADPDAGEGPVAVDVLRRGICGSDLHARKHCDELADVMTETGYPDFMRSNQSVVFGHEFCGEVLDHGPGTRKSPRAGTPVVAMPLVRRGTDVHAIGLSTAAPAPTPNN
jgi:hypothetical protein